MSHRTKYKRRKHKFKSLWPWLRWWFLKIGQQKYKYQREKKINGTSTKLKFLCLKGHHQVSEKTIHRTGENICNLGIS